METGADHCTEQRPAFELRAAAGRKLVGLAAVFDSPAPIGGFVESICPGAFRSALASGADVRALVDNSDDRLLGRTRSGTLRLSETAKGPAFELDVPDTTLGRDVYALAQRGDLSGCSFGFTVPDGGDVWPTRTTRELRSVTLHEISILHRLPAYDATTVAARARTMGRAEALARCRLLTLGLL
jgi:HK97 family phage prohead protease